MQKTYSITVKNIFHAINEVIIYCVIFIIAIVALYIYLYEDDPEAFFLVSFLVLVSNIGIIILPVFILYLNYKKYSKKTILVLEKEKFLVNNTDILLKEIKKIKIYATHQHFSGNNGATSLPYNDYFYYIEVALYSGEKLYLTSLLGYNLDKDIQEMYPHIHIESIIKSYPIIRKV